MIAMCLIMVATARPCPASGPENTTVADNENCLLCHRYPSFGRFDERGKKRVFYINEEQFRNSVHGKLSCKSCHLGLNEIPHTNTRKVDCGTNCHLVEPSTDKEFSHGNMIEKYKASVHGRVRNAKAESYAGDLPTCKNCHTNRTYLPIEGMWGGTSRALSHETLARCMGCHTEKQWANRFYSHFTHRMRRRRSQAEIVALCTECHEDKAKMARHGLETIETYKDTFHWKQVKYGVQNAPDCISCHVPVGYTTHDIRPRSDPQSPIHLANRVRTCGNQDGVQTCHPGAKEEFARGRVHAYGMKAQLVADDSGAQLQDQAAELVVERAKVELPDQEILHYRVLRLLRLFYRLLITGVIGFMLCHQVLDYRRSRKHLQPAD